MSIVIFLGVGTAVAFLVWPKYQALSQLEQEKVRKETELAYHDEYAQALLRLRKEAHDKSSEIAIVRASLPATKALPSLYDLMGSLSAESGLIIKSMSINPVGDIDPAQSSSSQIQSVDIMVQAEGSYEALKQFIESTKRSSRLLTVQNLRLTQSSEGKVFQYAIQLEAYSY